MPRPVAFLHYSAPPIVGGVENVMLAHMQLFAEAGYSTVMVAGRGEKTTLPLGADLIRIPEMDSEHPVIMEMARQLEQGYVSPRFYEIVTYLENALAPVLSSVDLLIVPRGDTQLLPGIESLP